VTSTAVPERAGQNDSLDRRVPVDGGIELDLYRPEAVALQHNGFVAERLCGCDRSLDVTTHVKKVVGVHVLIVLSRADAEGRVFFG